MQQYLVPLFIESESVIFGPLTLFQFIIIGTAGGISLMTLMITQNLFLTFLLLMGLGVPAVWFSFGRINGEKVPKILFLAVSFCLKPKISYWEKGGEVGVSLKEIQRIIEQKQKTQLKFKESRLRQIAFDIQTGKID